MLWNNKTVLVCFHPYFSNRDADQFLKPVPGYFRVKHRYKLTNWVAVEIVGDVTSFIADAMQVDQVAHCEYNFKLTKSSIDSCVGGWSTSSSWSCNAARKAHIVYADPQIQGEGVKIALIDTGMAPHPYLPALSFLQALRFSHEWIDVFPSVSLQELRNIADIELGRSISKAPLESNADKVHQEEFERTAAKELGGFTSAIRQQFSKATEKWLQDNLPNARHLRQSASVGLLSPLPKLPPSRHSIVGALRRVSLSSKNFVEDDLCILDQDGHGTQMAGLIAGRSGMNFVTPDSQTQSLLESYAVDCLGLAPKAELLVLKCWDANLDEENNVGNLVRALEYAKQENADIVYCGLGINLFFGNAQPTGNIHFMTLRLLEDTVRALIQDDIPIVCPAGNDGLPGLSAPAVFKGAIAVTAVRDLGKDLRRIAQSNYARAGEDVLFAGVVGDKNSEGLITTDLHFGFNYISGTSASAAIITGILARYIAEKRATERTKSFEDVMRQALGSGQVDWRFFLQGYKRMKLDDLMLKAINCATAYGRPTPSTEYGYGILTDMSP